MSRDYFSEPEVKALIARAREQLLCSPEDFLTVQRELVKHAKEELSLWRSMAREAFAQAIGSLHALQTVLSNLSESFPSPVSLFRSAPDESSVRCFAQRLRAFEAVKQEVLEQDRAFSDALAGSTTLCGTLLTYRATLDAAAKAALGESIEGEVRSLQETFEEAQALRAHAFKALFDGRSAFLKMMTDSVLRFELSLACAGDAEHDFAGCDTAKIRALCAELSCLLGRTVTALKDFQNEI